VVEYVGYSRFRTRINKLGKPVVMQMEQGRAFLPSAVIESSVISDVESRPDQGIQSINAQRMHATGTGGEPDPMRGVQLLPGIVGTNENNGGLQIRGSSADQSLITFDGFTLYHLDHMFGVLSSLNNNAVKSIRVHKGPLDARLGGRVGGVVEAIGKSGNTERISGKVDLGALAVGLQLEGPLNKNKRTTFLIAYRRSMTDVIRTGAYKQLFNTVYNAGIRSGATSDRNSFSDSKPNYIFDDFTMKWSFKPRRSDLVQWSVYVSDDRLNFGYADTSNTLRYRTISSNTSGWGNKGTGVRWVHAFSDSTSLLVNAGLSLYSSQFISQDSITDTYFSEKSIQTSSDNMSLRDFTTRIELRHQHGDLTDDAGVQITSLAITHNRINYTGDIAAAATVNNDDNRGTVVSPYADKHWLIGRHRFDGGARFNYYTVTGAMLPDVHAGWSYRRGENWTVCISSSNGCIRKAFSTALPTCGRSAEREMFLC
jgi:ferric enterobactin receptor